MITVEGLCKTFKVAKRSSGFLAAAKALFKREYTEIEALKDVSFNIAEGEIVGYIGPNGAGKSTSIKIMSGILVPDSGKCEIMGRIPWEQRIEHVKNIGVVFGQRSQLWWDVPVADSFELLKDIYKIPESEYKNNVEMLIETLDIKNVVNTPVRQLSLGQRMRCEIAASLLHSPKILFLDEPTIGLDAVSKIAVRQFIKKINKEKKVTVILTTHDMNDIEALAERILLIGKGRILYDGDIAVLRNRFGTNKTITVEFMENDNINSNINSNISGNTDGNIDSNTNYNIQEALAIAGTSLISKTPGRATFYVNTKQINVSKVISKLSEKLELLDVTVENPPIEEIIVALYKEYKI